MNVVGYETWKLRLGSYLANFKLLRVLALENFKSRQSVFGTLFGTNIGRVLSNLVYLRYLSLRGSNLKTFPWIHKLVLLQTLNLKVQSFIYKPLVSSNVLGKLAYLRHLYLPFGYSATSRKNFKLRFNGLSKLETLQNFDTGWCEVKDLPKLSGLRRLELKVWGSYDDVKEMFEYLSGMALSSTSCLRYLALDISILPGLNNDLDIIRQLLWQQRQLNYTHTDASLIRITTLKLSFSCLEEDPMPVLEKIPSLRELDLHRAYDGKEMVCSAMGFPRLTRLQLWNLPNLVKWRVEKGSMPILQHMVIWGCPKLGELPVGLIFLNSLRKLILYEMPSEFYGRVRLANGEGPDFYKIAHVPNLTIGVEY